MPRNWLLMYLAGSDVRELCAMLDEDPEIALIRSAGQGRWKAQRSVPTLPDGRYSFWHIPSGPIQLVTTNIKDQPIPVKNPFRGWKATLPQFEHRGTPWLGPAPLGIIDLQICRRQRGHLALRQPPRLPRGAHPRRARAAPPMIGISHFVWVGKYYSIIGDVPHESTVLWWQSLRRRVIKLGTHIPSSGPLNRKPKEIWAFPAALSKIQSGAPRADLSLGVS